MFKLLGRLLARIDRAVERADRRRIERYLGQSADIAEFEARSRELGYGPLEFATGRRLQHRR